MDESIDLFETQTLNLARIIAEAIRKGGVNHPILRVNYSPEMTLWSGSKIAIVGTNPGLKCTQSEDDANALRGSNSQWEEEIKKRIHDQGDWLSEKWKGQIQRNLKRIFCDALGDSAIGTLQNTLYFNLCFLSSCGVNDMPRRYDLDIERCFSLFADATDFILEKKRPVIILAFGNGKTSSPYRYLADRYSGTREDTERLSRKKMLKRTRISIRGRTTMVYGFPHLSYPLPLRFLKNQLYEDLKSTLRKLKTI